MLSKIKNRIANSIGRIHSDERGLEAIQVVVILAIAAIACIAVKNKWNGGNGIKQFFNTNVDNAIQFEGGAGGGAGG